MELEGLTNIEMDNLLAKLKDMRWKHQFLILKEGDEEIYRTEMLYQNKPFYDDFYKRLNIKVDLNDWDLKETEVNFTDVFYEWFRQIWVNVYDMGEDYHYIFAATMSRDRNEDALARLARLYQTGFGLFFIAFNEIKKYTYKAKAEPPIYTQDGYMLILDKRYKLYIELRERKSLYVEQGKKLWQTTKELKED